MKKLILSLLFIINTCIAATTTAVIGQSATFLVTALGTPPFTYQWYKDGATITGATSSTYSINKVALSDAGAYTVTLTNSAGSATSDYGVLSTTIDINNTFAHANLATPQSIIPWFFTPLILTKVEDYGNNFNNGYYIVPSTGQYLIVIHTRLADESTSNISFGIGAEVIAGDNINFAWSSTYFRDPQYYQRFSGYNSMLKTFNMGDKIGVFVYGSNVILNFTSIDFSIKKL